MPLPIIIGAGLAAAGSGGGTAAGTAAAVGAAGTAGAGGAASAGLGALVKGALVAGAKKGAAAAAASGAKQALPQKTVIKQQKNVRGLRDRGFYGHMNAAAIKPQAIVGGSKTGKAKLDRTSVSKAAMKNRLKMK